MLSLTPEERTLRARAAAHDSWANTNDRTARTAAGREAADRRFLDQVDPNRVLPKAERERRALHARKAFYAKLALKSARARRLRAEADQLDAEAAAA
ncbi:hypothetical protein [Nakamurella sp.]|uniref:hypothetical protein n=1 Tax=Nakamurella sp. TaxID=1869182 RepID=UPI0037831CC8